LSLSLHFILVLRNTYCSERGFRCNADGGMIDGVIREINQSHKTILISFFPLNYLAVAAAVYLELSSLVGAVTFFLPRKYVVGNRHTQIRME